MALPATMAPSGAKDDFDMAKLQKSLKQQQRRSVQARTHVTKLTPAEIRSLNNSALASQTGSLKSLNGASSTSSNPMSSSTPPGTPDNPSAYQTQLSRSSTVNLPTPPGSPSYQHRRASQSSTHPPIHQPKPRNSAQAEFVNTNGIPSRPASAVSYRGLPTYRGPEVTRNGSLTMFQRPPQNIVTNPLSNFSRPRQSMINANPSPDRCKHDSNEIDAHQAQNMLNRRSQSVPSISATSSRAPSPPRQSDSPVSIEGNTSTEQFPPVETGEASPGAENKPVTLVNLVSEADTKDVASASGVLEADVSGKTDGKEDDAKGIAKRDSKARRLSLGSGIFDKSERTSFFKKPRRRTLSFTNSKESAELERKDIPVAADRSGDTVSSEQKNNESSGEYETHPAIRPLSVVIPTTDFKGKSKEIHSAPVYGRCSCCGRLKRPAGFSSGLSPVMENENLRTNFSFEMGRHSPHSQARPGSSGSRSKYIPIIPMEIGENQTVQATIEPSPSLTERSSVQSDSSTRLKRISDPPKFVRFASLHGRLDGDSAIAKEDAMDGRIATGSPVRRPGHAAGEDITTRDFVDAGPAKQELPVEDATANKSLDDTPSEKDLLLQPAVRDDETSSIMEEPARFFAPAVTSPESQEVEEQASTNSPVKENENSAAKLKKQPKSKANHHFFSFKPKATSPSEPKKQSPVARDANGVAAMMAEPLAQAHSADTARLHGPAKSPPAHQSQAKLETTLLVLPKPHLGPHFARSNATLRDFVIPRGKSAMNLNGTGGSGEALEDSDWLNGYEKSKQIDEERAKREKWADEVMAV